MAHTNPAETPYGESDGQPPVFIETPDIFSLTSLLATYGDPAEMLHRPDVQLRLTNLAERTADAGKHLFVMDAGNGPWAVVADGLDAVHEVEGKLVEIARFHSRLRDEALQTNCKPVSMLASAMHVGDGILATGLQQELQDHDNATSIYTWLGVHTIGYADLPDTGKTVHYDLTAKSYVFAEHPHQTADAVMEGLMTVEALGRTDAIETLYQATWRQYPFDPDEPLDTNVLLDADRYLETTDGRAAA